MISYISKVPSEERCAASSKSVGLLNFRLRTWAKWIRPFKERIISGRSFSRLVPGTGAESYTVVRIVDHAHHAENVFLVDDDARKTKYAPGRIVWMDCHVDVAILLSHTGMMRSRKYFRLANNFSSSMSLYMAKSSLMRHALRLPARHDAAVGIPGDGLEHFLRIEGIHSLLGVSETVEPSDVFSKQFRAVKSKTGMKLQHTRWISSFPRFSSVSM